MTIIWLAVGVAIGWVIPQPTLVWSGTGERVGVLRWSWLKVRDLFGMN